MPQDAARIDTDVFIAGTGPAGSTFARLLVPTGRRVLMADIGAQWGPRPGRNLKNTFPYQRNLDNFTSVIRGLLHPISVPSAGGVTTTLDPTVYRPAGAIRNAANPRQDPLKNLEGAAASYAVGGMLLHWTASVPRQHPQLERWNGISHEEWDSLYSTAEQILNKHTDVFDDSIRNTLVREALRDCYGDRLPADYGVQNLPIAAERSKINSDVVYYTGTDNVLAPILDGPDPSNRARLQILPEHRVTRLHIRGDRIEYAEVEDLINWKTYSVYADTFVVAAGTVMSAQILWNSDIRPEALGKYMIEHPIAFTQIVLSRDIVRKMRDDPRFKAKANKIHPGDPVPLPMNDPPPNVWIPVSEHRPWHCQIHKDAFHYGALPADIDDRLIVDLRWFGIVEPRPENYVTFEPDIQNQFGMPQPTYHFEFSPSDGRRMHDMMSDMVEAAQSLGGFYPGAEPRFMASGMGLHTQGTCRIGAKDDGTSVVDPYSKVWGYSNLYVAGNSVIPTGNACNPTLTNVAFAVRAAQRLAA